MNTINTNDSRAFVFIRGLPFCYHPRVVKAVLFFLAVIARAQTLDDAVRTLAAKINSHLGPNETAHLVSKSEIPASLDRALRKRVRNPAPVDVVLTVSENLHGPLLVAQIRGDVEMASYRVEAPKMKAAIAKTLIWQQDAPILDVAFIEDQMLILDSSGITRIERQKAAETALLTHSASRDPRGRIEVAGDAVKVFLQASTCRGTWKPLALTCESGEEFVNNMAAGGAYSTAKIGEDEFRSEGDGRVHVYDSAHKQVALFDWGSDFVAVCGSKILASSAGEREALTLYEISNRAAARVSDPVEFPGPITALSATVAVAKNSGRYEAYSLAVDCGR